MAISVSRARKVHILTVDPVLAADVGERLQADPRLFDVSIVRPKETQLKQAVEEIERLAVETRSSRVIILDVRSQTLPRVQRAYNTVAGLNRMDLNRSCFTIVIGDGPTALFSPGQTMDVFVPLLAKMRLDYEPVGYFFDPFLHYDYDEKQLGSLESGGRLLQTLPKRLEKVFQEENIAVDDVRRYFRAATVPMADRVPVIARRQEKLISLFAKRLERAFPAQKDALKAWLTKAGHAVAGDTLRLHMYPLYFEDWVFDLIEKAG